MRWPSVMILALAGCAAPPVPIAPTPQPYTPSAPLSGAVQISFTLPRGAMPAFFDLPWPSELWRKPDGRPDFHGYPGSDAIIASTFVETAEQDVDGYSIEPVIYFHFSAPTASLELPVGPAASMSASSSVFLVDVDPESPERGTFYPLEHRWYPTAQRFVPAGTLAVKPLPGFVLRPGTLYAAVARRELGGAAELGTPMDLEIIKWQSPRPDAREEAARRLHAAALDQIAALGAPRDRIASVALFRTQVPHTVTARMLDVVTHLPPDRAPRVVKASWSDRLSSRREGAAYHTIEGVYCTPNFQSDVDRAPYLADDGGHITFDARGMPRLVDVPAGGIYGSGECKGLLRARFVMTIPDRPMPAAGYPLMVSAHGTGGDAETFLGDDDFAGWAASQGIAVVSTDQPLHGGRSYAPRPGSREPISISIMGIPITVSRNHKGPEVVFYNPIRPAVARDNLRQAAIDLMVLARVFPAADLASLLPADHPAPRFDRSRIMAAGHSQGSQSAAVMGALDPLVRGVILSGCGGDARLGVLRRNDLPIVPVFSTLLGLMEGELDEMHPLMALLQNIADPIDPASYARFYWEPLPGHRAASVLHYEGMTDTYTPPVTAEALAIALHATPIRPVVKPLQWLRGKESALADLLGKAEPTRAFVQYRATRNENGHFVIYYEPGAAEVARAFMQAVMRP